MELSQRKRILLLSIFFSLIIVIFSITGPAEAVSSDIVISQVYGGGGNSGATFTNDFIELFNRGTSAVDVSGWSVQYASASGSSWSVTNLSGTIQPGQYYLVQEAQGNGGTTPLPIPDATGAIAMSGSNGKVVLNSSTTALSGSSPTDSSIVDVVGYGSANFFEGSGAAPGLSNTTSNSRADGGCTDTDDNSTDFSAGAVAPRNSASPLNPCDGSETVEVFINELRVNKDGSQADFFEIQGDADTSLDGLTYLVLSGEFEPGLVDFAISLDGTTVPADGFYVGASTDSSSAYGITPDLLIEFDFINSPSTHLIVSDFTGAVDDDYDSDNDGTLDSPLWSDIVDSVSLIDGDSDIDYSYSSSVVGPDGNFTPAGTYRCPDAPTGGFENNQLDFFTLEGTPGAANNCPTTADLIITEIMYDPNSSEDDWEWVEIYNPGEAAVDLTGYVLDDSNGTAHSSANIAGGILDGGQSAILFNVDDVSAEEFSAAWGNVNLVPVTNWGAGGLNNGGDTVGLWTSFSDYSGDNTAQANTIDSVNYGASGFPDPAGASIYLSDLAADNDSGSNWAASSDGVDTPLFTGYTSTAAGGNSGDDVGSPGLPPIPILLLSEIVVTPTEGEFTEIYNPGSTTVDLSDVYISDATFSNGSVFYYQVVTGGGGGGDFSDFNARFPDGASINAGEYQTISLNGSDNFFAEYGINPTYELFEDGGSADAIPDMREATSGSIDDPDSGLTNSGEVVILYYWDGVNDLVQDLDYAVWGDKAEAVDKTGVSIDGPDADSVSSSYLPDVAVANQDVLNTGGHTFGKSWQRDDLTEGTETKVGGNGAGGHNEMSENLSETWCEADPTPGSAGDCPTDTGLVLEIFEIQGNGTSSPYNGQIVTTDGIVVADFQESDELNGFFLQTTTAETDNDPATSDGIFIFDPSGADVSVGDIIEVTGQVTEYFDLTEMTNVSNIAIQSSGNSLPAPALVQVPETVDGELEQYEGMYVTIDSTMTVAQNFFLGRYGQMTLSSSGRLYQPTNQFLPGSPDAIALAEENARNILILDDGFDINSCGDNPDPVPYLGSPPPDVIRAGDTVTNLTGVLDFGRINSGGPCFDNSTFARDYRLHPTTAPLFSNDNPRPAGPDPVGGELTVASLNVLNYFTTIDTGPDICGPAGDMDCRGADSSSELTRQQDKLVAALVGMDADIVGLVELENNAAANPALDGTDPVLETLVAAVNAVAGAGTYDFIDAGVIGTDAIKVALIYKTASVTPVGSFAILDSTVDPDFIDTKNRPVLAQTFENSSGGRLTIAVNHLKSKGSPCDDVGDPTDPNGQGNCNLTRTKAAEAQVAWLATDPTSSGSPHFMIIGDLNAYAQEDPITAIKDAGYTDLILDSLGSSAYSYIFDGQSGYLDHALASDSLLGSVTGVTEWHINADEPSVINYDENFNPPGYYDSNAYRASDHDPVIVGLEFNAPPICDAAYARPRWLWLPTKRFVNINIRGISDPDGESISIVIDSIFQDEPVFGRGSGRTSPDGKGVGTDRVKVRAERNWWGNGRYYHINFTATDQSGDSCSGTVKVGVPKFFGKNWPPVDDGPLYDSTVSP